jgi:hypothetical protein
VGSALTAFCELMWDIGLLCYNIRCIMDTEHATSTLSTDCAPRTLVSTSVASCCPRCHTAVCILCAQCGCACVHERGHATLGAGSVQFLNLNKEPA